MSEQEIPENYPRCRFCGQPMGDGSLILEEKHVYSSSGLLTICDACSRLIDAYIEDAMPEMLRRIAHKAEKPLHKRLTVFDYTNWEKYVKKKPTHP